MTPAHPSHLTPHLTRRGTLTLDDPPDPTPLHAAFAQGPGPGLLHLGGVAIGAPLPPALAWWRAFGQRYVTAACARPDAATPWRPLPAPPAEELQALAAAGPPMPGAEYLTAEVLSTLWTDLDAAFASALAASGSGLQDFLRSLNPAWHVVGRVHFNLAENRRDPTAPFAFLATYTSAISVHGSAQHRPLGRALRESAELGDKDQLLSLLLPVQRAAEGCAWLRQLVDAGEIFHPLRWSSQEAHRFLQDVPVLEQAGVIVRMPATWRSGRPSRPQVTATVGSGAPSMLGQSALLDFDVSVSLDGEPLTEAEVADILEASGGLALIRGSWVELDPERLRKALARFEEARRLAAGEGLPLGEALRLVAGADIRKDELAAEAHTAWAGVQAGPWLAQVLGELRTPQALAAEEPGLRGTLRPYQRVGVNWLQLLSSLGLGACLADDMGLGKTIQILVLLLSRRRRAGQGRPSLLVAPASLLANWAAELERFTPELVALVAHSSAMPADRLLALGPADFAGVDLVITTYGSLLRQPWAHETRWDLVVLDEAQAIKNPSTKQTRAAKRLQATARIALTGTPIENRLGDLWSIFDFLNPGLLGTGRQFTQYTKRLGDRTTDPYGPLRRLVGPYILRRLKTDPSVIADLPDKTELKAWCSLSRRQAVLYRQAVEALAEALATSDGMQRRGLVLSTLMRLKQICNHPSQWLGDGAWSPSDSGKWARLREICEVIAARQDKVLVFTQFRSIIPPLEAFLTDIFGRPGLVLDGKTPIKERQERVRRFQDEEAVPFLLLSLKAGGSGLNLTAASHVVHFDRWWNPAVEDQATDRAFRIGQTANVLVHKFVCRGTVEERIDALITSKRQLSQDILEGGAELKLTELTNDELLRLVSLDLDAAMQE